MSGLEESLEENVSYRGFVEYLHSQPPERSINHSCYQECAVADYVESLGFERKLGYDASSILIQQSPYENCTFNAFGIHGSEEHHTYEPMQAQHPLLEVVA